MDFSSAVSTAKTGDLDEYCLSLRLFPVAALLSCDFDSSCAADVEDSLLFAVQIQKPTGIDILGLHILCSCKAHFLVDGEDTFQRAMDSILV